MFKIQGSDQKEYGPVSAQGLRQWIAERRVDERTLVQAEGTPDWKPLGQFPEFSAAFSTARPVVAGGPPVQPRVPAVEGKTSGMALASLVCGLVGCLGITALVGLILGIVAQIQISKSGGRLKGSGLAIAGICVSALMLVIGVPFLAALLLPAVAKAKSRAQTIQCVSNLKQLALAVRVYANDSKDTLPLADSWCDAIQSTVARPGVFKCNADTTGQRCSYALNRRIAGMKESRIDPQTVLLFEIDGGWNVAGGAELINTYRHRPRIVVAFADGSVQQLPLSAISTLRWSP